MTPSKLSIAAKSERPYHAFGLIGYPLGHSLSPQIHLAALEHLGLDGAYNLYPIPPSPQGMGELDALLDQVRTGHLQGLNVTIPHKQNVIRMLDELTPEAKAIGAVNTIFLEDGRLFGDNTDAPGFWADLNTRFKPRVFEGVRALILGAGGSARSVAYALLVRGCTFTVAARRSIQADDIRHQFSRYRDKISIHSLDTLSTGLDDCYLIVNTTPVGMSPDIEGCPWPEDIPFPQGAAVYDLVYNPPETLLVRRARAAGLPAITGAGMLVEQAALAFERWTGLTAPRQVMLESLKP